MKKFFRGVLFVALLSPVAALADNPRKSAGTIARSDIEKAQKAWCGALIEIGAVSAKGGDAKAVAERVLHCAEAVDQVHPHHRGCGGQRKRGRGHGQRSASGCQGERVTPWLRAEAGYLLTHLNREQDRLVHTASMSLFATWRPSP